MSKLSKKLCGWILLVICMSPVLYVLSKNPNAAGFLVIVFIAIVWLAGMFLAWGLIDGDI